ncbi:MAG: response regulator [Lachnospiraceae bacterium]|nr:response regulator [Lachnospiraceae bacterium]
MKMKKENLKRMIIFLVTIFLLITVVGLTFCTRYIDLKLRESNKNSAVDIAEIVKNNFRITDEEVQYMKSLTFNEMEVDAINMRLMDIGNDAKLHVAISNIYLLAPLSEDEVKYHTDESNAAFFGYDINTPLDGIWLLNGKIDENGKFQAAQREDIYRYTHLTEEERIAMKEQESFGEFTTDAWGTFITGYTPIYTAEGNFVGLLGIDMDPDKYQQDVHSMIVVLMEMFFVTCFALIGLFLFLYFKYTEVEKAKLYFDFYSRMSHDMRTPMNGIMGMVNLAESEEDVTVLHRYFEKIGESSEYLLHLINDTLDVSRISSGKMTLHMEQVKYSHILENITDMIAESAAQHHITFEKNNINIEKDERVLMDPVRFKQIFVNLLTNAIKYTPTGGNISFTAECVERSKDMVNFQFRVVDTGVGMSEDYVKKSLYEPFSQEHNNMTDNYAGSGLGLSITKSLVALMGGTISVQSEVDHGTIFTVELNFHVVSEDTYVEEKERDQGQEQRKSLKGVRILLCEDHPMNAQIAQKLLEKEGCEITLAENGKIAVERFRESAYDTYDVILMDIRMPVMDGLAATKTIRGLDRPDAVTVPIIAMTANAYTEDMENTRAAGMNAHLSKPIQVRTLYSTIESMIKEKNNETKKTVL